MVETQIEIINRLGLHARAAAKLVHAASAHQASVKLVSDGEEVDAKSILGVLLLAAAQGTTLILRCDGPDEAEATAAIVEIVADRFGEGE